MAASRRSSFFLCDAKRPGQGTYPHCKHPSGDIALDHGIVSMAGAIDIMKLDLHASLAEPVCVGERIVM